MIYPFLSWINDVIFDYKGTQIYNFWTKEIFHHKNLPPYAAISKLESANFFLRIE
jgi:hypothetical protein